MVCPPSPPPGQQNARLKSCVPPMCTAWLACIFYSDMCMIPCFPPFPPFPPIPPPPPSCPHLPQFTPIFPHSQPFPSHFPPVPPISPHPPLPMFSHFPPLSPPPFSRHFPAKTPHFPPFPPISSHFPPIPPHFPPFPPIPPHFPPFPPISPHFPPISPHFPHSPMFLDSELLVWWVGEFAGGPCRRLREPSCRSTGGACADTPLSLGRPPPPSQLNCCPAEQLCAPPQVRKTSTLEDTFHPIWNETLVFFIQDPTDPQEVCGCQRKWAAAPVLQSELCACTVLVLGDGHR